MAMLPVTEKVLAMVASGALAGAGVIWIWWAAASSDAAPPPRETLSANSGVAPGRRKHNLATRTAWFIAGIATFAALLVSLRLGNYNHVASDDETMKDLTERVQLLRGDFEAKNPGWSLVVRKEGLGLASLMSTVNPQKLRPARRILQREYRGWALLMVARTFGAEAHEDGTEERQVRFATQAVTEFDAALILMQDVDQSYKTGNTDRDTVAVYEWMTGPSEDVERSHFLKAVAYAVIAKAGGEYSAADVRRELATLSPNYQAKFPPANNPDLSWALEHGQ